MKRSRFHNLRLLTLFLVSLLVIAALSATAEAAIRLDPVLSGLSSPVYVTSAHDGTNRLFVVEQTGTIRVLASAASATTLFLDITSKVLYGGERGLLGLAFHPQFASNGRFFVDYTRQSDGATVIAEYTAFADPVQTAASERVFLVIPQPFANHNGGMIEFGADGFLYIGMGDGGDANDPGRRAQNIDELLGKILRIDVDHPSGPNLYSSPAGNPFAGSTPGRDEIYAVGMRNPFRFSFDRQTGQLYVGDVGQSAFEEIDIVTVGRNYGWRVYEGNQCTQLDPQLCNPANFDFPIVQYDHSGGRCSIIGGYVYRGPSGALPTGTYVFGDFCSGEIFSLVNNAPNVLLDTSLSISSFGEDEAGELYVVGLGGTVQRIVAASTNGSTTMLTSAPNPATAGNIVTFTATVNGTNPTGTVDFTENGSSLANCSMVALTGAGNSRTAMCSNASLAVGTHPIVANYSGDVNNAPSSSSPPLSQVINPVPTFQLSGTVTLNGSGLSGVSFTAPNGGSCNSSNASGQYACTVPQGWSGSVTPFLSDYSFTPTSRSYSNVSANQAAQNYVAAASTTTVWVEDAVPAGATTAGDSEGWNWVGSNPAPFSGSLAHQSAIVAGMHQHYFYNATATLSVGVGDNLFAYVYLDPVNPPTEIVLQWNDGSWEHRAYWGANQINWGVDGTVSRRFMGPLPATGQWVRLEVAASQVGLEGRTLNGMAFSLYGGRATFDYGGKSAGAPPGTFQLSGTVTLNGSGLSGVSFSAPGGGSCNNSNGSGQYSCTVPQGWSGTVTPSLGGYSFTPTSRMYSNVGTDQTAQNYTATVSTTTVWVEDAVPAGATTAGDSEGWNWVGSNPTPFSGSLAHQSAIVAGMHQHYFYNATATLSVGVGDSLFAYVYLDPINPPTEIVLQWNDGSWEHRAYWGANAITFWGVDGTVSRRFVGPLPATGQWVRLEVAASQVGLEGRTLNGMAFSLYGGRATFDYAGKSAGAPPVTFQLSGTVTLNGSGLSGVSFSAPGGGSCNNSNGSGQYLCTVPQGWSGTVTPSLGGYAFTPASRTYSNVGTDQTAQNYTATVSTTTVWVEDSVPAGATTAGDGEGWNWVGSNPAPFSGSLAHQSAIVAGMHQHYFYNATASLSVSTGDTLFAYVYLDPANPPTELVLQWNDGSWEHRAYWGANQINWGVDGTVSRRFMGALPATGQWVRLDVPASQVGLEGRTLNGMAFSLYGGRATFDYAGKSAAP